MFTENMLPACSMPYMWRRMYVQRFNTPVISWVCILIVHLSFVVYPCIMTIKYQWGLLSGMHMTVVSISYFWNSLYKPQEQCWLDYCLIVIVQLINQFRLGTQTYPIIERCCNCASGVCAVSCGGKAALGPFHNMEMFSLAIGLDYMELETWIDWGLGAPVNQLRPILINLIPCSEHFFSARAVYLPNFYPSPSLSLWWDSNLKTHFKNYIKVLHN